MPAIPTALAEACSTTLVPKPGLPIYCYLWQIIFFLKRTTQECSALVLEFSVVPHDYSEWLIMMTAAGGWSNNGVHCGIRLHFQFTKFALHTVFINSTRK